MTYRPRPGFIPLAALLMFCCFATGVAAQEPEDIIEVRTRVVFVDALVRDKRTGGVIADLKREDFEVLDDGRPRTLDYFSREGDRDRKPLALVLALDLREYGASRFLKRAEVIEAMMNELSRLPKHDEVAVFVFGSTYGESGWLTTFTPDRSQVAAALARVKSIIERDSQSDEQRRKASSPAPSTRDERSASPKQASQTNSSSAGNSEDEIQSKTVTIGERNETITRTIYKNGETITRTIYLNGRARSIKTSRDGEESELIDGDASPLARATAEVVRLTAEQRPASQSAIVWVSDGIDPIYHAEQKETAARLLRQGVIFNALVAEMLLGFKLFKPVLVPLGNAVGMNAYGSAKRLARETGGVTLRVRRPDDYARGLGKIVGDLSARYSLGFRLDESEQADGRMHKLEVRVISADGKGKRRKLEVAARSGYFVPGGELTSPTAPTAQSNGSDRIKQR